MTTRTTTLSTKKLVEHYFLEQQKVRSGQHILEFEECKRDLGEKVKNIDWEEENKSLFEKNDSRVRIINKN